MKVAAAAAALVQLARAHKTFQIQANTTAVFQHHGAPFTQGLFVANRCPETQLSRKLDACVGSKAERDTPQCYVAALTECITLYETIGGYGRSELRVIKDFANGKIDQRIPFPPHVFAEGADIYAWDSKRDEPRILAGTWKERLLFDIRLGDVAPMSRTLSLKQEIWGVAADPIGPNIWITTGGTRALKYRLDKDHMELNLTKTMQLRCEGRAVKGVNELEFDKSTGTLWGNVWFSSRIYQFHPETGQCLGLLDLHDNERLRKYYDVARKRAADENAVWNGIAFLDRHWLLYTGKLFDHIFISKYF